MSLSISIQERLRNQIAKTFSSNELRNLCFVLSIDPDELAGETKTRIISALIITIAHQQQFEKLISILQKERPNEEWPRVEEFSDLDWASFIESANLKGKEIYTGGSQVIIGDVTATGDVVGRDKISIGNITDSYTAIGAGAQIVVNNIHKAKSEIDESEKEIAASERRLATAIENKVNQYAAIADADEIDNRANPYKSLLDYKLEDAPFFYGRFQNIQDMMARLESNRLTILNSDSGSGKTSLLQAGLASRLLASGHLPLYLRPYNQPPQHSIKKAFLTDYQRLDELARFRDENMSLKGFLERVTAYLGNRRLYIFLDQFEEFFTELNLEEQHNFAIQLRECVQSDLQVWWILSLRKEYFSDLRIFDLLNPFDNEYFLPTFKLEEAQEVITSPARLKGVTYENGLVDQILTDIRGDDEKIQPAQVQLVCYRLFEELPFGERMITKDLYNKPRGQEPGTPGAKGILTSHLSQVLDRALPSQDRKIAGRVLEALVTSDKRRAVRSKKEIEQALDDIEPTKVEAILKILQNRRLVRLDLEDGESIYQLTHDYLLTEIEIDPETQARKAAEELLAQEVNAYRLHGTLLSPDKFTIIESQRDVIKVNDTAQTLLDKSQEAIKAEEKAKESSRRRIYTGLAGGLIIVSVLAILLFISNQNTQEKAIEAENNAATSIASEQEAVVARETSDANAAALGEAIATSEAETERAETAEDIAERKAEEAIVAQVTAVSAQAEAVESAKIALSRQLAAQSINLLNQDDPELGLLLAIESGHITDTAESYSAIRSSLSYPIHTSFIFGGAAHVRWNKEENLILAVSREGLAKILDANTGEEKLRFDLQNQDDIIEIAWSSDDTRILTASSNGLVKIWNINTVSAVLTLQLSASLNTVSWNSVGDQILTASGDGAQVWNAYTGEVMYSLPHTKGSSFATWSNDEKLVLTSDGDNSKVWDITTGDEILSVPHGFKLGLNEKLGLLFTAGPDGTKVWDYPSGEERYTLFTSFYKGDWSPDGASLLSQSAHAIHVWDAESGQELHSFYSEEFVSQTRWNHAGNLIVSVTERGTARIWDVYSGQELTGFLGARGDVFWSMDDKRILTNGRVMKIGGLHEQKAILAPSSSLNNNLSWNKERNQVLIIEDDNIVQLWDIRAGQKLWSVNHSNEDILDAVWSPDETLILTTDSKGLIKILDSSTGQEIYTMYIEQKIHDAGWSVTGNYVFSSSTDLNSAVQQSTNFYIKIFDSWSGDEVSSLHHFGTVDGLIWSKDDTLIVAVLDKTTVKVWDVITGEPKLTLAHEGEIRQAVWNRDETLLLTTEHIRKDGTISGGAINIWNANNGTLMSTLTYNDVAFWSADWNAKEELILARGMDDTIFIWDPYSQEREIIDQDQLNMTVTWNKEGNRILSTGLIGTINLWDVDGKLLHSIQQTNYVGNTSALWNNDENLIVSWSQDNLVRVWHSDTGNELFSLTNLSDVRRVIWNEVGDTIIVITENEIIPFYVYMEDLIDNACAYTPRNLSWVEWQQLFPEKLYRPTCVNVACSPDVPTDQIDPEFASFCE